MLTAAVTKIPKVSGMCFDHTGISMQRVVPSSWLPGCLA